MAGSSASALLWPRYLFPLVWIGLFLFLDPLNAVLGNPSLTAQVRLGRWDSVLALCAAGLVCGGFWEMWNVFSMPKWVYDVPFVGRPRCGPRCRRRGSGRRRDPGRRISGRHGIFIFNQ